MYRSTDRARDHREDEEETWYTPKADQGPYNFTPSQAATSYAESMTESSVHAKSRLTTYTYASDRDAQQFLKKVDDRSFNTLSDTYYLPTDDEEWARLDKQHIGIVLGLGGLYPAREIVQAILAPGGETKSILDLGCGTGVWATAMANEFPHARVVGVDLAPIPSEAGTLPSNCRFEIDNINLGLSHLKDQFDVIHMRLVATGLQNFRKSMDDIISCLKPGGIVIVIEGDYDMYSSDYHVALPVASEENPSGSWTSRFFYEIRRAAVKAAGSDLYGMAEVLDEGFWDNPLLDPETCRTASLYNPIGTWAEGRTIHETQQLRYVGALFRQDMIGAQQTVNPLLKRAGWSQDELDGWYKRATEEMSSSKVHTWGRMRLAWGRRRSGLGEPAPPLHNTDVDTNALAENLEDMVAPPSPHLYVYDTKEQARLETEIRNRSKNSIPPPEPVV